MIKKLYRVLYKRIIGNLKPLNYARKVGVNMPKEGCHIYGKVQWGSEPWIITVGKNVHITDGVKFITHDGGTLLFRKDIPDLEITAPIIIGNNVYIGNNAMIMPNVIIGDNVVIGAGTIVTKNVPNNSVVVGIPGRVIESTDEYLEKISKKSLHLGHLKGQEKDRALMKYYGYKGTSKGIYY